MKRARTTLKFISILLPILACYILQSNALASPSSSISSSGIIAYPPALGWLHTDGRLIKDEAGKVVLLHGVARGETSYAFSSDYQGWYRHHEVERDYDRLKKLGVNVVRLALSQSFWETHATLRNVDGVATEYTELVDDIVSWCKSRNIYVILEHHDYISQKEKAQIYVDPTSWMNWLVELATRYKDQRHVSISILNEPPGHSYSPAPYNTRESCSARWRKIASAAIEAIRAVNPNVLVWVEPAGFVGSPLVYDFSGKPLPYPNIVYCMHTYYHSALGSIVGNSWPPMFWAELYWNGELTQAKREYELFLQDYGFNLLNENVPVAVTEFGVYYPDNNWDMQIRDLYEISAKYGVSWMQWWWHGHWIPKPSGGYKSIDYHLLEDDWITLTAIGKEIVDYLAST